MIFFLIENIDLNQLQKGKKDFLVRILFVSSFFFFLNRFNLIRKQERNTMFADMKSVLKCAFEEEDQKKKITFYETYFKVINIGGQYTGVLMTSNKYIFLFFFKSLSTYAFKANIE